MKPFVRAAALAGALVAAGSIAFAQAAPPAPPVPEPQFSADRFRAHVTFLADDLLEGRGTGQRGHLLAAHYVAQQFHGLGLKPAGDNGTWFQAVKLQERALAAEGARLTITSASGAKTFANTDNVLIQPSATTTAEAFEAPLVFAGFGFDDPKRGFDDYRGLDVKGKVVVVLAGSPKGAPSELAAHLNQEKAAAAARRGAIGLLTIDTDLSEKNSPWARRIPAASFPRMTWVYKDGKPHLSAPGLRGTASLNRPAAELLFEGARKTLAQVRAEAAAEGGRPRGFPLKGKAKLEIASTQRLLDSPNVAAVLPGSDPALKDEYVVVMGHLDHLGIRPDKDGDKIYNGALDNASGIAAIIETARAFVESGQRPRRSILFLAVTAEEKGLLGSDYFGEYPLVPLDRIAGVVNIDMPILTYDFGDIVAYGGESSTLGEIVRAAAARMGMKVTPDPTPEQGIFTRSDHYQLVRRGVPSIFLKTGPMDASGGNGGREADRSFRSNQYHDVNDDLTQPIDWQAGAKFTRINWLIAREIANADVRPRWYRGDFFGDTFAPKADKAPKPAPAPAG